MINHLFLIRYFSAHSIISASTDLARCIKGFFFTIYIDICLLQPVGSLSLIILVTKKQYPHFELNSILTTPQSVNKSSRIADRAFCAFCNISSEEWIHVAPFPFFRKMSLAELHTHMLITDNHYTRNKQTNISIKSTASQTIYVRPAAALCQPVSPQMPLMIPNPVTLWPLEPSHSRGVIPQIALLSSIVLKFFQAKGISCAWKKVYMHFIFTDVAELA